jgi:hypothetical protein
VRIWCLLALVAIGTAGVHTQPGREPVVVIVDTDGPVANAETSARLREQALARVERYGLPVYFDLTADAITPVPDNAGESFRRATFTFQPPIYAGVSLSFGEASEILRKNEAVRDAVIRRECSTSPASDCGGAVHAAATTLVTDTEGASSRKLRRLAATATSRRAATLILITAGWPYHDEQRLGLGDAIRELRAAGTRLVVLRVPALVLYRGLVKDASETVASRLSATFIALTDQRDIERAHQALVGAEHVAPETSADIPVVSPTAPGPRLPADASTVSDPADDVLRRAAGYVALFERTFAAAIWREHYRQEDRIPRRFSASGATFSTVVARRQLDSELLFVWLPQARSWITVRDVMAIDGKPRPAGDRRLQTLLGGPSVSVDQLSALATENGRFNIGRIVRTFNEPTLALLFLDEHYRHRFTFVSGGPQTTDGRRAATFEFVERASPTVIRDQDRDVPVRGTLWIDATTGRVLHTSLELSDPSGRLRGRMTVRYGPHPNFDVLVPLEMRETYTSSSGEEVNAVATYSEFRRFETAGRLIIPK